MQRAGELTEIKAFTGKKTLMNAVALVLHILLYDAGVYNRVCYSVARSGRGAGVTRSNNNLSLMTKSSDKMGYGILVRYEIL